MGSVLVLFIPALLAQVLTVTWGQECSDVTLNFRYKSCLDEFLTSYYSPTANNTGSQDVCRQARDAGVACVNAIITKCANKVPDLEGVLNSANVGAAFQQACDSSNDVSLANRCYTTINSSASLQTCEQTKRQELSQLRNLANNATTDQLLCLSVDARSSCMKSSLQSQCQAQSVKFISFLDAFFPAGCYSSSKDNQTPKTVEKSKCGDDAVMVNFTECIKPFFERIAKIELDSKSCNNAVLEALRCVAKIVDRCSAEKFEYIQKLLDLNRTKNALDFGCARNWGLATGAFCYNKHYGSDIKPCLDKEMMTQMASSSENTRTFQTVCRYIDATTDCAKTGMTTCKDEAVTFTEYVRRFFPRDCTDDLSSASSIRAVFGLVTSLILVHLLMW